MLELTARNSQLRKKLNPYDPKYVTTLVRELPATARLKHSYVYFDPQIPGGYAWLFPMDKKLSCGVGVDICRSPSLKDAWQTGYEKFRTLGLVQSADILNQYYNIIYTGGPVKTCIYNNIVLVGDAAGQIHPITGAGIAPAMICARILAEKCHLFFKTGDINHLKDYEKEWRALYEPELLRGIARRQRMIEDWSHKPFTQVIRNSWVTFSEYYKG